MAPSCKLRLSRFSVRLKFQDRADCGNIRSIVEVQEGYSVRIVGHFQSDHPTRRKHQNVVRIFCFGPSSKNPNISACFGRDFIESGFFRQKFRLPTRGILETTKFRLFWRYNPLGGPERDKNSANKYFSNGPSIMGNQISNCAKHLMTQRGGWDTLVILAEKIVQQTAMPFYIASTVSTETSKTCDSSRVGTIMSTLFVCRSFQLC